MKIELPFPPSSLSGHNKGHWRVKSPVVKKHRDWAEMATKAAKIHVRNDNTDILIRMDFYPPDNRGDRVNYPNRMKPYIDGVADALGVNDKRFLPSYHFHAAKKPGKVVVTI